MALVVKQNNLNDISKSSLAASQY